MSIFLVLNKLRRYWYFSWFNFSKGTRSIAELFLIYLHFIADYRESKCLGRSEMIWFIKGKASIAVPSTTSIIIQPTILSIFSMLVKASTILAAIEPPIECPTTITFFSGKRCSNSFKVSIVSVHNVSIEKSSFWFYFFEWPCPFKSAAITVPKCLTSFARVAKLRAESPAPCMQKNIAPSEPALNTEVPLISKLLHLRERRVNRNSLPIRLVNNFYGLMNCLSLCLISDGSFY